MTLAQSDNLPVILSHSSILFVYCQALQAKLAEFKIGDLLIPLQQQDVTLEVPWFCYSEHYCSCGVKSFSCDSIKVYGSIDVSISFLVFLTADKVVCGF